MHCAIVVDLRTDGDEVHRPNVEAVEDALSVFVVGHTEAGSVLAEVAAK